MIISRTCSWCHGVTAERRCPGCGHRADVARLDCDCPACGRRRRKAYGPAVSGDGPPCPDCGGATFWDLDPDGPVLVCLDCVAFTLAGPAGGGA